MRNIGLKAVDLGAPSAQRRHVGLSPCFIDEDEAGGLDEGLILILPVKPAGDGRVVLLSAIHHFFEALALAVNEAYD